MKKPPYFEVVVFLAVGHNPDTRQAKRVITDTFLQSTRPDDEQLENLRLLYGYLTVLAFTVNEVVS